MSQFDRYTTTEYVEALRVFLNLSKSNFLREAGFLEDSGSPRRGRLKSEAYEGEPLKRLEEQVNEKAARCEASDTSLGERYRIARDYQGMSDAQVSRAIGYSRELVRRWGEGIHTPKCLPELAELLKVPLEWLEEGGEDKLPANSHLGVRVGEEAFYWREQLYGLTQSVIAELPDEADEQYVQAAIEWSIFNQPELAKAARRAGGRWQIYENTLLFAPWVPIPEHGLSRRHWSDEVESIIQEELAAKPSVYGAWEALKQRCEAMGLGPDEYPRRISLHKRVEKERERAEKFGVDLNDIVAEAVAKYSKQ